jgi:heparanase 1
MTGSRSALWLSALTLACAGKSGGAGADSGAPTADRQATVSVSLDAVVATIDPRALSFAVDSSQVAGTEFWAEDDQGESEVWIDKYDFDRPALRPLAAALAPAMLRIGGTDADHLWYDTSGAAEVEPPEGFRAALDAPTWERVAAFASDTGLELFMTLNAGPMVRDEANAWVGDNARDFMAWTVSRGDPVAVWELGNELNAYALEFGTTVTGEQYGADLATLASARDAVGSSGLVAGPSVAYWPLAGEIVPTMEGVLDHAGALDLITWHYYPQQSERCPAQSVEAGPAVMLDPERLDEVARWAGEVEALRDARLPGVPIWLGESGNAQCGGAPGVSDRWSSSFWWLDQLGLLARRGHPVSVRQTLSGSDYGMLDDETLEPRPDYWASLLWRRTMGTAVLDATSDDPSLRAWAHCAVQGEGAVSVLLLNLHPTESVHAALPGLDGALQLHLLEADALDSLELRHNGVPLEFDGETVPPLEPEPVGHAVLPPQSIAVAVVDAGAGVCP